MAAWRLALGPLQYQASPEGRSQFVGYRGPMRIALETDGAVPPGWTVRMALAGTGSVTAIARQACPDVDGGVVTGDEAFDEAVLCLGDEREVLARLGHSARLALLPLINAGAALADGRIVLAPAAVRGVTKAHQATALVDCATVVLGEMQTTQSAAFDTGGVYGQLAAREATESHPGVKARIAEVLAIAAQNSDDVASAIARARLELSTAAIDERAALIRAADAMTSRDLIAHLERTRPAWGVAFLLDRLANDPEQIAKYVGVWPRLGLAEATLQPRHWELLANSLRADAERHTSSRLMHIILRRASGDGLDIAATFTDAWFHSFDWLVAMRNNPTPELAARLALWVLTSVNDPETQAEAMSWVAEYGDARSQGSLLRIADSNYGEAVRLKALEALGATASPTALPKLEPLTGGFFRSGDIKRAAKAAMGAIAERHAIADAGGLSVTDEGETTGGLSPAEPGGGLSLD